REGGRERDRRDRPHPSLWSRAGVHADHTCAPVQGERGGTGAADQLAEAVGDSAGVSAGLVGLESEWLVTSLSPALTTLHLPAIFVGLIVIPIIGNAAEHASAVFFAARDRLDLTLEIAVGSSTQIALFVAPILVFVSLAIGHPMDFVFTA